MSELAEAIVTLAQCVMLGLACIAGSLFAMAYAISLNTKD